MSPRSLRPLVVLVLLLVVGAGSMPARGQANVVVRERPLNLDTTAVANLRPGEGLKLQLFDDVSVTAIAVSVPLLLAKWGPRPVPCPPFCGGDLDEDCMVSVTDFFLLLALWG